MSEPTVFYNTTGLSGTELQTAISRAKTQNERVMLIMRTKNRPMTTAEVYQVYLAWFPLCPESSIKRAMTTLTLQNNPVLTKTDEQVKGGWGHKVGKWMVG